MEKTTKTKRNLLATGLLAGVLVLVLYALLGVFPFGGGTIITGDMNGQYVPYYAHFRRAFFGDAGFGYGFDKSLGGSLVALFAYYISSPLNLLYLTVPVTAYPVVASVIFLLKTVLASVLMALLLGRKYPGLGVPAVLLSLGYGLSSWCVGYLQNIMWHDVVVLLPVIILGLERILTGGTARLYTLTLALAIFANFYIAWMVCIFVVVYFGWALVALENAPRGPALRQRALRFVGASLVAGLLNAVLLLPTVLDLQKSKGLGGGFSFSLKALFGLEDFASYFVLGNLSASDVQNGRAPMLYCGLLAVVLLVCYFAGGKINIREKMASAAVVLLLLASFRVEFLNLIWHGFAAPVDFPWRNAFLFGFFTILLGAGALARGAVTKRCLLWAGGILATACIAFFIFTKTVFRRDILITAVVGAALLAWVGARALSRHDGLKRILACIAAGVVCLELLYSAFLLANTFEKYRYDTYGGFVQDGTATVEAIRGQDTTHYRIEKNFFRTLNDGMLLDYQGLSHFGSTQDNAAVDTLSTLGYGNYSASTYLYGSTAFADSVLALRYLYTDGQRPVPAHWQPISLSSPHATYQNKTSLPIGFAVGQLDVNEQPREGTFAFQNQLYSALSGDGAALFLPQQSLAVPETLASGITFTAQAAGYYYMRLASPAGFVRAGYSVNGSPTGEVLSVESYGVVNLGWFEAGSPVQITFEAGLDLATIGISELEIYYMDVEKLEALATVAHKTVNVETFEDGRVELTIVDGDGGWLFTSIPYAEGWTATVNGEKAETYSYLTGFMAVDLPAGTSVVELTWKTRGLGPGWAVSLGTAAAALGWLVFTQRRKKETGA